MSTVLTEASPAAAMGAGPLIERLAQRGSKPLGVIDVRQPQQHYARSIGWLGQRLPLLSELLARYRDDEEQGAGAGGFIYRWDDPVTPETPTAPAAQFAGLTPAGKVALGRMSMAHRSSAAREPPAVTAAAPAPVVQFAGLTPAAAAPITSSATPALTRVKRPAPSPTDTATGALADSRSALPEPPTAATSAPSLGRMSMAHRSSIAREPPTVTAASVVQFAGLTPAAAEPITSSATPAMARVKRQPPPADAVSTLVDKTLAEITTDRRADSAAGIPNPPTAPSSSSANAAMESRGAVSSSRRMAPLPASARPIAGTGRPPVLQLTAAGPSPVIPRKVAGAVASAGSDRVEATAAAPAPTHAEYSAPIPVVAFPLQGLGRVARSAGVVRNDDSTSQTAMLYLPSLPLARKAAALPLSTAITATADLATRPPIQRKTAVAAPVPDLVWRRSLPAPTAADTGHASMTTAGGAMAAMAHPVDRGRVSTAPPIVQRQAEPPRPLNDDNAQLGPSRPAVLSSQSTELDFEALLVQMNRRLLRQLTIERERRGGKKWS